MARRNRDINLPAPYLKRLWLDPSRVADREAYPFCLPFLHDEFSLSFDRAITTIVGENGTGRAGACHGRADRSHQVAARVLRRSQGVRGSGDRGVMVAVDDKFRFG
jgi:hypothetical protein